MIRNPDEDERALERQAFAGDGRAILQLYQSWLRRGSIPEPREQPIIRIPYEDYNLDLVPEGGLISSGPRYGQVQRDPRWPFPVDADGNLVLNCRLIKEPPEEWLFKFTSKGLTPVGGLEEIITKGGTRSHHGTLVDRNALLSLARFLRRWSKQHRSELNQARLIALSNQIYLKHVEYQIIWEQLAQTEKTLALSIHQALIFGSDS